MRTQLAIAFFVLAVLPLVGVTLYTWLGSQRAFRKAVTAEAGDLAAEMSTRVDVVADELKARLQRMGGRPVRGEESAYAKARREALAAAEGEELRLLLRAILSGAHARRLWGRAMKIEILKEPGRTLKSAGEIPFRP